MTGQPSQSLLVWGQAIPVTPLNVSKQLGPFASTWLWFQLALVTPLSMDFLPSGNRKEP